jgi:DNA-binding protein
MEEDLDNIVGDIITQLKGTTALARKEPEDELTKDKLEEFIIKNSGKLINKSLNIIDEVQAYISSAPDAKDVAAFAELLKASSASMESLNKIYISLEKNKTTKDIKQMDLDSKEKINTHDNITHLLSRKEIMKELMGKADKAEKPIDV